VNARSEVQLLLLRHAHAGDPTKWSGNDDLRPLSDKGRRQAERLGRLLAETGFRPDAILSSPKLRALETAEPVAAALGLKVARENALAGPMDLDTLEDLLAAAGNPSRPLLVGHDPDFSDLAATLAGLSELPLRKGALVRIDTARPLEAGAGSLRWLVPPDLLAPGD
jgi:phosphohistidine phosphatase SixA